MSVSFPRACLAVLVFASLFAASVSADHVLTIDRQSELHDAESEATVHSEQDQGSIYLGESRARFDQGDEVSWILHDDTSKLYLVRHDLRVYHVFDVPLVLEDYATPSERRLLEERSRQAIGAVEVETSEEVRTIDGREARRVDVHGESGGDGMRLDYELWLSDEVPFDARLYRTLVGEFGSADVMVRPLARRLAELPGFPIVRRSVARFGAGHRSVDERRLVSIEERSLPPSTFDPPAEYREMPFSIAEWLTLR